MKLLSVVAVLCPLVSALAYHGPKVTPVALELDPQGWTPRPTTGPSFKELRRRQSEVPLSLIEGPDYLCGYQFGDSGDGLALCGEEYRCGFATAAGASGEVFCFGTTTSAARTWTSCVAQDLATSCINDAACSDNSGIVMCTESSYTYCNLGTFIGLGVEAVWCDTTFYSDTIPISTTYVGQIGREFTTPGAAEPSSTIVPNSSPAGSTPVPTNPSPTTPTPNPGTPTPSPAHKKSTPVGAIVGGVIGGIAIIVGIAIGIFFCIRHNNKKKGGAQPANTVYPPPAPVQQPQLQTNNTYPQYHEKAPVATQMNCAELQQPTQSPPVAQSPPQQSTQQYAPPGSPTQNQNLQQPRTGRESVVSSLSSPASPAPPYASTVPPVQEMAAITGHHASPISDRYEMQ